MLLLREETFSTKPEIEIITEGTSPSKNYYLSGCFMQAESLNKNGRIYPKAILEKEIERFQPIITGKLPGAIGELGHPDTPTINLPLGSHLITSLKFEGNDIVGKAKILDTTNGRLVKTYLDEGITLGMSSRGMGSIKQENNINYVQEDYHLATIDIVAEPSAPGAWVNGIMEGKEWLLIDGVWTEYHMDKSKKLLESVKAADVEKVALLMFKNLLNKIQL